MRKSGAKLQHRLPSPAEWVSDAEQDGFGYHDALDEQEGAIGAEDAQRAFDLASPIKRQRPGHSFDDLKIFVGRHGEKGGVPPPGRDDEGKSADERSALEGAEGAARPASTRCRFTVGKRREGTFQLSLFPLAAV